MPKTEPGWRQQAARRERELRIAQAVIGGILGACGLGWLGCGTGGWDALIGLVGGVGGALAGYKAPLWLSSIDRP